MGIDALDRAAPPGGTTAVLWVAIAANLAIAIVKFIAAWVTGSSAMTAEGIHSMVDTGDGVLMLVGGLLAQRPAEDRFPFGRGKELYFWSLVVAMIVFGVGGGLTFYEGIRRVMVGGSIEQPLWSYVVLASAVLFESISFGVAFESLRRYRAQRLPHYSLRRVIRMAKDPRLFTVVLEDGAALLGLLLAFVGILLSSITGEVIYDGIASSLIGLVLAGVALVLARECRSLLVGERALPDVVAGIRAIAGAKPAVAAVVAVRTMQIGAESVLVALELGFVAGATSEAIHVALAEIGTDVRARHPEVSLVCVDTASLAASIAQLAQ